MAIENLSTTRVLVVDDKPDEAVPVLTALGEAGVGCIYLKGDKVEELPTKPVEGIRLVFLDMRLAEGGNQRSSLSKTIGVLQRCIPKNTMPLVIICWTRHKEDVDLFTEMVTNTYPSLTHGCIVAMPKPSKGTPDKWKNTLKKIQKTLRPYEALGLIWQWENIIHGAATDTSQTLADVSNRIVANDGTPAGWQDGIFSVCRELVRADAGMISNPRTALNALFHMMNQLAVDRIHHAILKRSLPYADKLIPHSDFVLGIDDTSQLNQMILIDPVSKEDTSIAPGFIYVQNRGNDRCLFKKLSITLKLIKNNITNDKFSDSVIPILIEISPACDFVQDKRPVCMFIAGLLIPADSTSIKRSEGHREVFGPVRIPGYSGMKNIVVTKRLVYACPLIPEDISNRPICRLRSNALIDLQVKTAMYKARPGTIYLDFNYKRKKKNIIRKNNSQMK
jgi:hypothetical protein